MAEIKRLLKVLISSKQSEFALERADIVELMAPMPLLAVIAAEHWTPEALAVEAKSVKEAAECSIYVGLFGAVYSEAVELEYREASKNSYREIVIYIKDCANRDARLDAFIERLSEPKHGHTVCRFSEWSRIRSRFEDHLWAAVGRMIENLVQLGNPPRAMGYADVFERRWLQRKSALTELGLPGDPRQAQLFAALLSRAVASRAAARP